LRPGSNAWRSRRRVRTGSPVPAERDKNPVTGEG